MEEDTQILKEDWTLKTQVALLFSQTKLALIAVFIVTLLFAFVYQGEGDFDHIIIWVIVNWAVTLIRFAHLKSYQTDPAQKSSEQWLQEYLILIFFGAIAFGSVSVFFFPHESTEHQAILVILITGMMAGSIASTAPHKMAFLTYQPILVTPVAIQFLMLEGHAKLIGLLAFIYLGVLLSAAIKNHQTILDSINLRFSNNKLVEELTEEVLTRKAAEGDLETALALAQEGSKAKSEFLAKISHEVRTPLNAIIGFSQLLEDRILDEEDKTLMGMVLESSNHLLMIINDVLDISRIEAGKVFFYTNPVDIAELLQKTIPLLGGKAQEKGLALTQDISLPPSLILILDETRLRQILLNLIGNGIKFTQSGEVKVTAFFNDEGDGSGQLTIAVKDTGIGIAPEDHKKVFDKFQQAESHAARSFEGTGLGLSICKNLAELMGGTIELKSEVGKGSTFTLTLNSVAKITGSKAV